jgi:lysophospholipase L1-like esterase
MRLNRLYTMCIVTTTCRADVFARIVCAVTVATGLLLSLPSASALQTNSPSLATQTPAPNPKLPTLYLIGDSTVRNGQGDGANGQWGWGEPFAAFFDPAKINVVNRALGGRSSRTYLTGGQWDKVLGLLKRGDFVIMQFGHNDGGAINDDSRARGSIRGAGEETQEIDNLLTKEHEVVHTYGWYLRRFIADTKARGATPIVCSLVPRKIWKDGKIVRNSGDYGGWAADVARSERVAFVDLNEIIARKYDDLGPEKVEPLFADPHTHTSLAGAELNAACVAEGLKALKENPLAPYFSKSVPPAKTSFKFSFEPDKAATGYVQVSSSTSYSSERGYGFEPESSVAHVDSFDKGAMLHGSTVKDLFFSVSLPEGNYNVTVTLGDTADETTTTVRAELRRLMLEKVHTARGQFQTRSFMVNVRTPQIASGGEVKLKDREKTTEARAWDDKLTLEFYGECPAASALEITRADSSITLYLLGDSTVCDQPSAPFSSWGQMLTRFFGPGVAVANHAESGESLKSSLAARRLDKVLSLMKPGDYLFIQYGHNDEKESGEGVGAFTSFKADLGRFVAETRKRGGIPVLITPVQRRTFDPAGKIVNSHGDYPDAVRQVAKEANVPLIDLQAMSKTFYEALGPEGSKRAFAPGDGTHHSEYGSYELAKCIMEGIKSNKLEITKYLVKDVPHFDPTHPDSPM